MASATIPVYPEIPAPTYANGILDYAINVAPLGTTIVSPRNMGSDDLPNSNYVYGVAIIQKRSSGVASVTVFSDYSAGLPPINASYSSGGWVGWKYCGSVYVSSVDVFKKYLLKAYENAVFLFKLSTSATDSIFGIGTYISYGYVTAYSATSARGEFTTAIGKYTFEYNPTAGTLTSLTRYIPDYRWNPPSSTSSDTFTVANSTRAVIQTYTSNSNLCSQFMIYSNGSGTVTAPLSGTLIGGSGLTFDVSTPNKLKITHGSATVFYIVNCASGSVTHE